MSTNWLQPVITGAPQPAKLVKPPEISNAAVEVVELASSAGLILDPWQCLALDAMMGEANYSGTDEAGEPFDYLGWAATTGGIIVPRRNGKGAIAEARELAGLFLFGEKVLNHTAHVFKTANDAFLRIVSLIEQTPDLSRLVRQIRRANGEQAIWLRSGASLQFIARTGRSGRGLGGDFLLIDEAFHIPPAVATALVPTISAGGGNMKAGQLEGKTQVWFMSSPPVLEYIEEGRLIRRLRADSIGPDPVGTAWVEYSCEVGCDLDDPENWRAANPALGIRISEQAIKTERSLLDDDGFAVERLGTWMPEPANANSQVFSGESWAACEEPESSPSDPVTFGLEVSHDRDQAVIVAVGDWNGRPCVEIIDERDGTGWVVERLVALTANHDYSFVCIDQRSAAGSFIAPLEEAGVRVDIGTTRTVINAAGTLFDAINAPDVSARLAHRGDPRLTSAVLAATRREIGDAWALGRRSSSQSIISVVALSLALLAHVTAEPPAPERRPVFAF